MHPTRLAEAPWSDRALACEDGASSKTRRTLRVWTSGRHTVVMGNARKTGSQVVIGPWRARMVRHRRLDPPYASAPSHRGRIGALACEDGASSKTRRTLRVSPRHRGRIGALACEDGASSKTRRTLRVWTSGRRTVVTGNGRKAGQPGSDRALACEDGASSKTRRTLRDGPVAGAPWSWEMRRAGQPGSDRALACEDGASSKTRRTLRVWTMGRRTVVTGNGRKPGSQVVIGPWRARMVRHRRLDAPYAAGPVAGAPWSWEMEEKPGSQVVIGPWRARVVRHRRLNAPTRLDHGQAHRGHGKWKKSRAAR